VLQALVRGEAPWPLYLHGAPGTGKTSAALALLDLAGAPPTPGTWPEVVRDWLAGFAEVRHLPQLRINSDQGRFQWSRDGLSGDVTWASLYGRLKQVPLFVFDDIGTAREATDFRRDLLLDVLGARCDDPVKPFVVTSNCAPAEIERLYDERVASRILCGSVFELAGADRRFSGGE
jgi:hypothetical protein